ncbi:hypothetical protein SAMN04488066_10523 [Halorubrum aquaticum]|uniref:HVO-0234-like beta-propeller domain-containing protein n=1 Tax=Halorubrum aquaticum TaxID=387340 RepID=A0A1I3ABG2_9EURY|nr:hypothetical protein [Halorubrum aquaticum]SFH47250.1 hypothetical protein SAMN04488066_10523 [Halorubrum aquaticum]
MAPAEDDISIEEKRVYAGSAGRTDAYVATETGVVRVAISGDKVGEFELTARDPARDVAVLARADAADVLAVATDDDLLVAAIGGGRDVEPTTDDAAFSPVGIGPAVAVGVHDGAFLAADAAGGIHRVGLDGDFDATAGTDATRVGDVNDPRSIDGPLVAAGDGVHRVVGTASGAREDGARSLESVGLSDARDVAGAGVPLAATASGLYWLGNGWMSTDDGDATAVAADGDGHAMATVDGDLLVRGGGGADVGDGADTTGADVGNAGWDADAWRVTDLPVDDRPAALGYGPGTAVAVTDAGTLCVDAGDGWRHQAIGVRGIGGVALAVVE